MNSNLVRFGTRFETERFKRNRLMGGFEMTGRGELLPVAEDTIEEDLPTFPKSLLSAYMRAFRGLYVYWLFPLGP